jgi:cell division protein FtsB
MKINKNILWTLIIPILFFSGVGGRGLVGNFYRWVAKAEETEKKVEKLEAKDEKIEEDVEENEEAIDENEKIDLKQTILIEQINKDRAEQSTINKGILDYLNKLNKKIDEGG